MRPEPAGGAEQHEAIDAVGVIGGELLGDAAAGGDAGDVDRARAEERIASACSSARSAIDIPRGSPPCG